MKDLTDLSDILLRFQRLDDAATSHSSLYDRVTLNALQHNLSKLERGTQKLRQRLVRRGELLP